MPDIGPSLREARMRARIDISEIESETKIRAKYLRALENEEWDLLPGPTYVKSFLRTYAEALGLDGKLLVEEYKLRHERLSDVELQPIAPPSTRDRHRGPAGRRGLPRGAIVGLVIAGLLIALYVLGSSVGSNNSADNAATTSTTKTAGTGASPSGRHHKGGAPAAPSQKPKKTIVALRIVPTGPVYVCLQAAGGRRPVNGVILQASSTQPTYRSSRFRLTLGNGSARLLVNGRPRTVPAVANGIGYEISSQGRRTLTPAQRPKCGA
ncbi:MAG TPA: helix-turn-helix domain-containing protein [Candidatus Limnocylindria bacterium]|jgi:cytoskeletal protein RodZ|nr:helix-turn-helix domain-containing protein [Candidatus Limnocylindria bacterium]